MPTPQHVVYDKFAVDMTLKLLRCGALLKKKTEQVNKHMMRALGHDEEVKVSKMHSVTHCIYSGYVPVTRMSPRERVKIQRSAAGSSHPFVAIFSTFMTRH